MASGKEFLEDAKLTVMHSLYRRRQDLKAADSFAESAQHEIWGHLEGSTIYIPNLKHFGDSRERVLELHQEGKKAAEIIRITGLAQTTVYEYIRNRNRLTKRIDPLMTSGMKTVAEMKMAVAKALLKRGIIAESCKEICEEFQSFILKNWGGITFNIPKRIKLKPGRKFMRGQQVIRASVETKEV
jgi:Mor family transcriptional regulator